MPDDLDLRAVTAGTSPIQRSAAPFAGASRRSSPSGLTPPSTPITTNGRT